MTKKDQRIKADIIGPNTQSGRFPVMSPLLPTHPGQALAFQHTASFPLGVVAGFGKHVIPTEVFEYGMKN